MLNLRQETKIESEYRLVNVKPEAAEDDSSVHRETRSEDTRL